MTDDIVARLRLAVNELYGTHPCGLMNEAADRIEQLEAALRRIAQHDLQAIAIDALRRVERVPLEAALKKIAQYDLQAVAIDALRPGERVPLEGKDDR